MPLNLLERARARVREGYACVLGSWQREKVCGLSVIFKLVDTVIGHNRIGQSVASTGGEPRGLLAWGAGIPHLAVVLLLE